jgi:serine/threonine protein kinase/tetratricopeptide (TPR) repeat protein
VNWPSVERLFAAALEMTPEERQVLLDSDPDDAVRAEVRKLLARHDALFSGHDAFLGTLDLKLAAMLVDAAEPAEPVTVGRYEIVRRLGSGATGVVYLARDPSLGRQVALKLLSPHLSHDATGIRRFTDEARAASRLDNPHIVAIHEIGRSEDDRLFIAMAYHEGETLRERIAREALPVTEAVRIAADVADGLSAAHAKGIIHRDIKPENILLTARGACIVDFGIAKVAGETLTRTGAALGTAAYMSPEQTRGAGVDHRSDLWSLGVVLYEMLTGVRPFRGESGEALVYQVRHDTQAPITTSRPDIPPAIALLVGRCMDKEPALRYESADDLIAALGAPGSLALAPVSHGRRRVLRGAIPAAFVLTLLSAIGLSPWLLRRGTISPTVTVPTLAVLPFDNLSQEPQIDYLAAGLGDAIRTDLSRLSGLIVPGFSPTSIRRVTGKPLTDIPNELGVTALVSGSVQRVGDQVRVEVALFDPAASHPLWTRRYARPLTDLRDIQRDATRGIAAALHLAVTAAERALLLKPTTTSAQAYDLYLRGRALELEGSPPDFSFMSSENIRVAQSFYWRARELDPAFALARARLALTHMYSALRYDSAHSRREQARLEAEAALRLQPRLSEAHEALMLYWAFNGRDTVKSLEEVRLALEGSPNNANLHVTLGVAYRKLGRWEDAVRELDRGMRLEPRNPGPAAEAAITFSRLRRYEESIRAWDRLIALVPEDRFAQLIRGYVYLRWTGSADTLAAALARMPAGWDQKGMGTWARFQVLRVQRRPADALAMLNASRHPLSEDGVIYRPLVLHRAQAHQALGQRERARSAFEAARALLADSIAAHPDDPRMRISLGVALAGLGRKEDAAREARHAMKLVPLSQDGVDAPTYMGGAAEIFASAGAVDAALELLELLLAMPAGREVSVALLRVDPTYDPLRSDPRFEQLLERFSAN